MTTSFVDMRLNANRFLDGMTCNVQKMARDQIDLLNTVERLTTRIQQIEGKGQRDDDRGAPYMRDIFGDSNIFAGTSSAFQRK